MGMKRSFHSLQIPECCRFAGHIGFAIRIVHVRNLHDLFYAINKLDESDQIAGAIGVVQINAAERVVTHVGAGQQEHTPFGCLHALLDFIVMGMARLRLFPGHS